MFNRFIYTSLISFGLGLGFFTANTALTPLQAEEPLALPQAGAQPGVVIQSQLSGTDATTEATLKEQGIEPLDKGPVHEAFAQPGNKNPQPGLIVHKQPPQLVDEMPPDQKPEGNNVQWIKGYWAWDADRNDFIWVSGFWRVAPPERHWVQGSWVQVDDGWQWSPGYWAAIQQDNTAYLPQPPESLDYGPSTPAPSDDTFYVPGNWVYTNSDYVWQPGFWSYYQPGYTWVDASYYWTPYGYVYSSGYWDYPWWNRGWLFAPVWFHRPWLFWNTGHFYRPFWGINTPFLSAFFWGSRFPHHYWYGRPGDPFFARSGFHVASFNRVNNSVAIGSINSFARTTRPTGPVVAPINRIAANTRLGPDMTARGVTRANGVNGRSGVASSGSVNRGSAFATSGRSTPTVGNIHTTPGVTTPASGSAVTHGGLHERGPAPLSSSHSSAPVTRRETASPHLASPHVTSPRVGTPHVTAPNAAAPHNVAAPHAGHLPAVSATSISHRSAPTASHLSMPSIHAASWHFSAPAMHAPAAHFSGGGHVGGGHSAPSHMGGGGHSGGVPHGGGGHPAASGYGHK